MITRESARPPWWAVVSAATAVGALVIGWVVAETVQNRPYDPFEQSISTLARHGADHRWIMTLALVVVGGAHLITAAGLRGARWQARVILAAGGVVGIGVAVFAQPDHGSSAAHIGFAVAGLVILVTFPPALVRRGARTPPLRPRDLVWILPICIGLPVWTWAAANSGGVGLAERVATFQQELWPLLAVLALRLEPCTAVAPGVPSEAERLAA